MVESKYISVIHIPTDKIVTAFKLENDATWIGKEKDELIATANYCEPGKKVKMIFVKSYTKKDGKFIHPYFRSASNQIGLKENMSRESNKHKKCKENVYEGIYSGEIKINGEEINKSDVDDIYIEYRTSKDGYVIPDVLIKFKKEHIKYGLGIFIEIQLSKQYEKETIDRTYSRVIEGFSGIWLWENDFDEKCGLIKKDLEIKSHKKLLSELNEKLESDFINRINNYGNIIDKKLVDFKKEIWGYFNSAFKTFQIESESFSNDKINKMEIENKKLKELKELADTLDDVFYKTNAKELTNNINKAVNEGLIFLHKSIKEKNNELLKECIDENIKRINRLCPKCGKPMKIGKAMSGYNWYCSDFPLKCDGLIKDVNFNEN